MNFSQFDSYSGLFHFPTESLLSDFQENGNLFLGCQAVDRYGNDEYESGWFNDDKLITTPLNSTSTSPLHHKESQYPQRTSLLGIKKRKLSDLPKSEPLVTKKNRFIYKDEYLWNDSKELPDVILVSPRKETTPEPNFNTFFSDDEKANDNLNLELDKALQNVQADFGIDLDSLLSSLTDPQPVQNFDQDLDEAKNNDHDSDLNSFNEISCNINQQGAVTDSQSAIKKLLKDDSFKGNFNMKKSTEILSAIDQWHDCFAEHNYFSPTKELKPRLEADSETPVSTSEYQVASATLSPSALVPVVSQEYVVETEISNSANISLELKPAPVASQCSTIKSSSCKPAKVAKNRDTTKKSKKPVLPKATLSKSLKADPTYKPYTKKPPPKKSQASESKTNCNPAKSAAELNLFSDCNVAKLLRIPIKSSSCEPKPNNCGGMVKSRLQPLSTALKVPSVGRWCGENDRTRVLEDAVAAIEPDPVDMGNPPTPLASPTKDDFMDHDEFTIQDSCQPETRNSNVDLNIDPIQPVEVPPKIEKKKISLQEYMQKRATEKPDQEILWDSEPDEPVTQTPVPNIEDILRTIVKPELRTVGDAQKSIVKSERTPIVVSVKSQPPRSKVNPSVPKPRPDLTTKSKQSRPKMDQSTSKPRRDPITESKPSRPKLEPVQTTESKPSKEPQNNAAAIKLIKVAVPDRTPSARSYSLSPNEVSSQSLDSCDRCSSSGISSYHNSSVSSMCGSPYTVHDDKSNDTKYFDNESISTTKGKKPTIEKKLPNIPFAVNEELLRKDDCSSRKRKHRRDQRRRSNSITRKRKFSDSCFEDDSDCSDYSDRKRPRKRYISTSSSSSSSTTDKSYHRRSHHSKSISPQRYRDWKYPPVPESYYYPNYNELPNMYYPVPPPAVWHPDFGPYYPAFVPNIEVPYYYNGSHEPLKDTGEGEIDRRALFVGNIEDGLSENELISRFEKYGHITHVKICTRDNHSNYGFVYFTEEKYVHRALERGKDDPDLPPYKLGYGIRREHHRERRGFSYDQKMPVPNYPTHGYRDDSFNLKLEKFKNDLKEKKLNDRYNK